MKSGFIAEIMIYKNSTAKSSLNIAFGFYLYAVVFFSGLKDLQTFHKTPLLNMFAQRKITLSFFHIFVRLFFFISFTPNVCLTKDLFDRINMVR